MGDRHHGADSSSELPTPYALRPTPWRSHWDDAFAEARAARKPVLVYADGEG